RGPNSAVGYSQPRRWRRDRPGQDHGIVATHTSALALAADCHHPNERAGRERTRTGTARAEAAVNHHAIAEPAQGGDDRDWQACAFNAAARTPKDVDQFSDGVCPQPML